MSILFGTSQPLLIVSLITGRRKKHGKKPQTASLRRSLAWPPKALLQSGRTPHGRTGPPPEPRHEAHGDHFHCPAKTLASYITLTGQEGTAMQSPQGGWPQTSLALGPRRRPDPHRQPGVRPPFLTGSSRGTRLSTQGPPVPSTRGPRPDRGGHVKHFGPSKGKDGRRASPLNPSWSPACTRSFYSNQNGCRRPWQPRDPGSPWRPSGSGRLEPSCSETRRKPGVSGQQKHKATPREAAAHSAVWSATPKPENGRKETCRHALSLKKNPQEIFKES